MVHFLQEKPVAASTVSSCSAACDLMVIPPTSYRVLSSWPLSPPSISLGWTFNGALSDTREVEWDLRLSLCRDAANKPPRTSKAPIGYSHEKAFGNSKNDRISVIPFLPVATKTATTPPYFLTTVMCTEMATDH